jgi:hypothetical protein
MLASEHQISTIVRFSLVAAGLAGCTGAPRLERATLECDERLPALCATFGTDTHCTCASRNDLERFLAGFGAAAWPGAID